MSLANEKLLTEIVKIPISSQESFEKVCHALYSIGCGEYRERPELEPDYHHATNVTGVVVRETGTISLCFKGEESYFQGLPGTEVSEQDILSLDPEILKPKMEKLNQHREEFLKSKSLYAELGKRVRDRSLTKEQIEAIGDILSK